VTRQFILRFSRWGLFGDRLYAALAGPDTEAVTPQRVDPPSRDPWVFGWIYSSEVRVTPS